jgi:hypothetical protein
MRNFLVVVAVSCVEGLVCCKLDLRDQGVFFGQFRM